MKLVLDTGALIAFERADRRAASLLQVAFDEYIPIVTSAGCVAQSWRNGSRQARLARLLHGIEVQPLDAATAKDVGILLNAAGLVDVVDAHVALLVAPADHLLTSDPADLTNLLTVRNITGHVLKVL